MNLYLVLGTSTAPAMLVGTQADAKREARERGTSWEPYDVATDKAGLMEHLNAMLKDINAEMHMVKHVDYSDSADLPPLSQKIIDEDSREKGLGYTEQSITTDDAFDALPLARQLDLAARAMENARDKL